MHVQLFDVISYSAWSWIFGGKAYKRGVEYHDDKPCHHVDEAGIHFAWSPPEALRVQCDALKKALHARSPNIVKLYGDIQWWYSQNLKPQQADTGERKLAHFLTQYLKQV